MLLLKVNLETRQDSISSNDSFLNESIEQRIEDWLNSKGIYMEEPEVHKKFSFGKDFHFNSKLILKNIASIKKKH